VELNQHVSGMEQTASKIHAKFIKLILHAMLRQNVVGMRQRNAKLMFVQIMLLQIPALQM
jgi:hypothetical protein